MNIIRDTKQKIKQFLMSLWCVREQVPLFNIPIPCHLPYGGWILAYGDMMGSRFFLQSYLRKSYEGNDWKFIYNYLKTGMIFMDVGANQGIYTLLASKQVGNEGKVIAFEPVPSVVKKLQKNILLNRFKNVAVEISAIGNKEGVGNIYVCLNGMQSLSSLRQPSDDVTGRKKCIQIPVTSLDSYISKNNLRQIDFIKIDVEGGELDVLTGGCNVWSHIRPIVMCEIEDKRTNQWNYSAREIYDFLAGYNYDWFETSDKGKLCHAESRDRYDKFTNLIAVPSEKISFIQDYIER